MLKEIKADNLNVRIYPDRLSMGNASALMVGSTITQLLSEQESVNMIFAAAPSQNEFLAALLQQTGIDWTRINAFHMDEYISLPQDHTALFSSFLKNRLFDHLPFRTVNYIRGDARDTKAECKRYADLLLQYPTDIVCMGIGENGHIAFNDPHIADFNDLLKVRMVDLGPDCRQQQVNDACFAKLDDVPTHAITLTIPALMAGRYIFCMVPGKNKASAVGHTLNDQISEACPASVLRRHPQAILFLDSDSFR